jgi:hypothetical protein
MMSLEFAGTISLKEFDELLSRFSDVITRIVWTPECVTLYTPRLSTDTSDDAESWTKVTSFTELVMYLTALENNRDDFGRFQA